MAAASLPTITSTRNSRVVSAAKLARADERRDRDRYLLEGPNAVAEGLTAGVVERVFTTAAHRETYAELARDGSVEVLEVTEEVAGRLADTRSPQGVVAVATIDRPDADAVVGRGLLLVLDGVSDPGNAGTVIRTADACGAAGVVLTPGTVDPYNPKAVRASAGSITHLPVVTGVALGEVAAACRSAGQTVVGLDPRAPRDVFTLEVPRGPVALVLGNEAHGLDPAAGDLLDMTLRIPLHGGAESLNLAAAAAVAAYAATRGLRGATADSTPPANDEPAFPDAAAGGGPPGRSRP